MAKQDFDAIVVGGGHAGIEAAAALSRKGFSVAMVTLNPAKTGAMSCNPAIGGVAKSHLVYEIDALGGWMGRTADRAAIQARRLNMKKGPAVRSTRVQCDKDVYQSIMCEQVAQDANITVLRGEASDFLIVRENGKKIVNGVRLKDGSDISSRTVLVTAGTFMSAIMFCGEKKEIGGRVGDPSAQFLSSAIRQLGHSFDRLKTGTPARLDGKTIRFEKLEKQWGDPEIRRFSWHSDFARLPQLACYITYTNERTHEIIRANFEKSPLFSGDIQGVGPRYCPSIEDKVKRFPDRGRHQIFLEPEGLNTESIYPNGMSTSLPEESQLEFLRSIEGLEKVEILKPGYAVEYDSLDPTELNPNLMSSHVEGLFFAGQVNRSSGYEEAAAQGLWAGINAGRYLNGDLKGLRPDRSRSYMETLVEDLVFKGTKEPYLLFTSRSEYRLHLREDNAHDRMIDLGLSEGLLSPEYLEKKTQLDGKVKEIENTLKTKRKRVSKDRMISLFELLKRPEENWEKISMEEGLNFENALAVEKVEIQSKYSGYLGRIESEIKSLKKAKELSIDYDRWNDCKLAGVSAEVREKVLAERPENIYELSRMSGVSSVDLLTISKSLGVKRERVSHETM